MTNGYENIKLFYEKVWYTLNYKQENILEFNFKEFVSSTYDNLVNTKYTGHEKFATHGLKLPSDILKASILDIIFSNLYCEFLLFLQNLDESNHGMRHEIFLTSTEYNKTLNVNVSQNCKERFRRRMQPNRLNLIKKVKIKSNDKISFYSPVLLRAFKESLLIARPNTEVLDISKNYADIFYSLMFDSDEEAASEDIKTSREIIKSHRLWKLTPNDTSFILNLIQNVIDNEHGGDQFAQIMLLEKLFGLHTIADLWNLKINGHFDDFSRILVYSLSTMRRFGYCLLHQYLIDSITIRKPFIVKDVIDRYLYPICTDMLKIILKTIFKSLESYDNEQRVNAIARLIDVCSENSEVAFSYDAIFTLLEIPPELLVELIKGINGLNIIQDSSYDFLIKLLGIVKLEDGEGMKNYLKIFSSKSYKEQFYNLKYKNIDYESLFDISLYDLTFTEKHIPSDLERMKILNPHSKNSKRY